MDLKKIALRSALVVALIAVSACSTRSVVDGTVNTAGFATKTVVNGTVGAGKLVVRGVGSVIDGE